MGSPPPTPPEVKTSADGTRVKTFLTGVKVAEYGEYDKPEEEEP